MENNRRRFLKNAGVTSFLMVAPNTEAKSQLSTDTATFRTTVRDETGAKIVGAQVKIGTKVKSITEIEEPEPPTAVIDAPSETYQDVSVNFDASQSSAGDGTIESYEWGGAAAGSGPGTTESYPLVGEYTANLKVTDSNGNVDCDSHTVTVQPGDPFSQPDDPFSHFNIGGTSSSITTSSGVTDCRNLENDGYLHFTLQPGTYLVEIITDQYGNGFTEIEVGSGVTEHDFQVPLPKFQLKGTVIEQEESDGDLTNADPIENAVLSITGEGELETTTDYNGNYNIGLGPGNYNINVQANGYVEHTEEVEIDSPVTEKYFSLEPMITITGVIHKERGQSTTLVFDGPTTVQTTTDEDGHYEVDLQKGNYTIEVTADGYAGKEREMELTSSGRSVDFVLAREYGPSDFTVDINTMDSTGADVPCTVTLEGESTLGPTQSDGEITFEDVPGGWWEMKVTNAYGYANETSHLLIGGGSSSFDLELDAVPDGTIQGAVVDQEHNPVANANIEIGQEETTSNSEGNFDVTLPSGYHSLVANAEGYETHSIDVQVPKSDSKDIKILLQEFATLSGIVEDHFREDHKVDDGTITIEGSVEKTVEIEDDGTFEISLPSGDYTVTATGKGLDNHTKEIELDPGENSSTQRFYPDWKAGEDRGAGPSDLPTFWAVHDGSGVIEPCKMTFLQTPQVSETIDCPRGHYIDENNHDESERYPFAEGWYKVVVHDMDGWNDGYEDVYLDQDSSMPVAINIQPEDGELPTGLVEGTLRDENDDPVEDAVIHFEGKYEEKEITTDSNGFYSVELIVGSYRVEVSEEGFVTMVQYVQVQTDNNNPGTDFALEYEEGYGNADIPDGKGLLDVRVYTNDYGSKERVEVTIFDDDGNEVVTRKTGVYGSDLYGWFSETLAPGIYTIQVDEYGYKPVSSEVEVVENLKKEVELLTQIELPEGATQEWGDGWMKSTGVKEVNGTDAPPVIRNPDSGAPLTFTSKFSINIAARKISTDIKYVHGDKNVIHKFHIMGLVSQHAEHEYEIVQIAPWPMSVIASVEGDDNASPGYFKGSPTNTAISARASDPVNYDKDLRNDIIAEDPEYDDTHAQIMWNLASLIPKLGDVVTAASIGSRLLTDGVEPLEGDYDARWESPWREAYETEDFAACFNSTVLFDRLEIAVPAEYDEATVNVKVGFGWVDIADDYYHKLVEDMDIEIQNR